jgi:hypothetical protein
MMVFLNAFIVKTIGKGQGLTLRPLFLIGVWHIKQNRKAWLSWVYNLLWGSHQQNMICMSGYCIVFVFVRTVSKPCVQTSIKTRNFVTFYKFLIHLGVRHTIFFILLTFILQVLDQHAQELKVSYFSAYLLFFLAVASKLCTLTVSICWYFNRPCPPSPCHVLAWFRTRGAWRHRHRAFTHTQVHCGCGVPKSRNCIPT